MANYYRVKDGNWDLAESWATTSGGSTYYANPPTSADDVFFDANTPNGTHTINTIAYCNNFTMTGFTGTLAGSSSVKFYGNVIIDGTFSHYGYWIDEASSGTQYFNSGGKNINGLFIEKGGNLYLASNISITHVTGICVKGGSTFHTANFSITAATIEVYDTSEIYLGSSTINLTWQTNWRHIFLAKDTATVDAGTSTINFAGDICKINAPGFTLYDVNTSSTVKNFQILSNTTFHNLLISYAYNTWLGGDITINGTFTHGGTTHHLVLSSVQGTQRTITSANNSLQYIHFKDIKGAGEANWNLSAVAGGSGDGGGNSGITFSPARTLYWVSTTGGNWNSSSSWSLSSGGAPGVEPPRLQDDVIFDANSITSINRTIYGTTFMGNNIDFSDVTHDPTLTGPSWQSEILVGLVRGNITFSNQVTLSNGQQFTLTAFGDTDVTWDFTGSYFSGTNYTKLVILTGYKLTLVYNNNFVLFALSLYQGELDLNGTNITIDRTINTDISIPDTTVNKTFTMGSGTTTLLSSVYNHDFTNWNINCETSKLIVKDKDPNNPVTCYINLTGTTAIGDTLFYNIEMQTLYSPTKYTYFLNIAGTKVLSMNKLTIGPLNALTIGTTVKLEVKEFDVSGTVGELAYIKGLSSATTNLEYTGTGTLFLPFTWWYKIKAAPPGKFYVGLNSVDAGENTNIYFRNPTKSSSLLLLNIN